jgi:flavin reductase (DIM6/NTAB) family NADH-FMN oxidoreductase RutF/rubredoxin
MDYSGIQEVLDRMSYGLYLVSSYDDDKLNAQISNAVIQVTAFPPQVAVSINKKELTHTYIMKSKRFAVNILEESTPMKFIGIFGYRSGKEIDKFSKVKYKIGKSGCPIVIEYSLGFFEAEVVSEYDVGTHTLFIGKVINSEKLKDCEPLTYVYFKNIKGGKVPKNAPTYRPNNKELEEKDFENYVCNNCNYFYNPLKGDADTGIPPGTPFEKLPNDWKCPLCGANKGQFSQY